MIDSAPFWLMSIDGQIVVVADTVLLTGHTVAGTNFQVAEYFVVFKERLFRHSPSQVLPKGKYPSAHSWQNGK